MNENLAQKVASVLDGLISSNSSDHSALALGYTLNIQLRHLIMVRDKLDDAVGDSSGFDVDVQKYGSIAKRNDCLKFCDQFLTSSAITDDQVILKKIFFVLVNLGFQITSQFFL